MNHWKSWGRQVSHLDAAFRLHSGPRQHGVGVNIFFPMLRVNWSDCRVQTVYALLITRILFTMRRKNANDILIQVVRKEEWLEGLSVCGLVAGQIMSPCPWLMYRLHNHWFSAGVTTSKRGKRATGSLIGLTSLSLPAPIRIRTELRLS